MSNKVIAHVDMNNFYASVECMLDMSLRDKAVAVCGSVEERHGIVLAKNYKAKAFGVKTGEAVWEAKQKCKDLVVVPPHYEEYMKYSRYAREIYESYTDQVEAYGMDECWLDLSGTSGLFGSGEKVCNEIRERIKFELGLTVSVGLSFNKIFAKLGSDIKKPDALTIIPKDSYKEVIWGLPACEMLGVGRATEKVLTGYGIKTLGDLANSDPNMLKYKLKSRAYQLVGWANGQDQSTVLHKDFSFPAKSFGHGQTAIQDLEDNVQVWKFMLELCQEIGHKLRTFEKKASGIAITVRDSTLYTKQWQHKIPMPTMSASMIARESYALFERSYRWNNPIRSLTVSAIDLVEQSAPQQLDLFFDAQRLDKLERLDTVIFNIRERFGNDAIQNAVLCQNIKMSSKDNRVRMPTGTLSLMGGM